jgi:hypothetical protein
MLSYVVKRDGETLESFVCRYYHVSGADGEVDRLRLRQVCSIYGPLLADRADIQWVEKDPGGTQLPKQTKLPLLDVPGVPRRDIVTRPLAVRNLKYAGAWLLGLVLGSVINAGLRLWAPWMAEQLITRGAPIFLLDLPEQLLRGVTGLNPAANAGLAWPAQWSVLVLGVWLYFYPSLGSPYARARLRYGLGWFAGLVVLGYASAGIWTSLPVDLTRVVWPLEGSFVLIAVWTLCVFGLYIVRGDDSEGYLEFVAPYRGIWLTLSLVVLAIGLAAYANYESVNRRVEGLMASRTLASQAASAALVGISDTQTYAQRLLQGYQAFEIASEPAGAEAGLAADQVPDELVESIRADWLALRQATSSAAAAAAAGAADVDEAIRSELRMAAAGASAATRAGAAAGPRALSGNASVTSTAAVTLALGTSLLPTRYALTDAMTQTARISNAVDQLVRRYSPLAPTGSTATLAEVRELRTRLATEVLAPARIAQPRVQFARDGIEAVGPNVLPVVVGTTALLAAFVLMPWVLLVVFLFRKRRDRAAEILRDLRRLDPSKGLIKRTLGIIGRTDTSGLEADLQPSSRDLAAAGGVRAQSAEGGPGDTGEAAAPGDMPDNNLPPDARQFYRLSQSVDMLPGPRDQHLTLTQDNMKHLTRVINSLATRAFNSAEYVLSLSLVSVLVSVGWYFVLYPQTSVGLALLIVHGADVPGFTELIWSNLTPVTAGFLGAYFFVLYQLVNRYLAADLYPAAYLQAAERFAIVFIVSLMLWVVVRGGVVVGEAVDGFGTPLAGAAGAAAAGSAYLLAIGLAFIAGIWPREGLRQIIERVQTLGRTQLGVSDQTTPLTQLEGLTIWDESRLREEKVSDIQSLATTSIGDLVVNTHYPATQLVDWIDQAILFVHAGQDGELYPAFRWVGIRTATDLLDAVGYSLLLTTDSLHKAAPAAGSASPGLAEYRDREFVPDKQRIERLCKAIRSAAAAHAKGGAAEAVTEPVAADDIAADTATDTAADTAEARQALANELETHRVAAMLTPDLLFFICDAILPDQNMDYVLNWYAWLGEAPALDELGESR